MGHPVLHWPINDSSDRCERGKGVKPRWAVHGVEFLIISSGPTYTQHLSDEEFASFKVRIEPKRTMIRMLMNL